MPRTPPGAACEIKMGANACPNGQLCNPKRHVCTTPEELTLGDPCDGRLEDENLFPCSAGSTCIGGACRTVVALGGSCADEATTRCDEATRCTNGVCESAISTCQSRP
jgi:hypothetical protein